MSNTTFDGIASGSGTGVDSHYKGSYLDSTALITAHPTASAGDWAYVNPVGGPPIQWTWDDNEVSPGWVNTGFAGTGDFVGPAGAVSNNIVTFYDNTGKIGKDSGVAVSSIVVGPASAVANHIPQFSDVTGKLIKDGLSVSATVSSTATNNSLPTELAVYNALSTKGDVTGPSGAVDGNIVLFDGVTGKLIKDGLSVVTSIGATGSDTSVATEKAVRTAINNIPSGSGDVVGPTGAVDGNIVLFDGVTGKLIKDGLSVSTIISSASDDTELSTAKAVYDAISVPVAFDVLTLNEKSPAPDATVSEGKLYVLPATGIDSNANLLLHLNFDPSVTDSSSNNVTCTFT